MARIFTTPAAEAKAKAFMHDIAVLGGTGLTSQRTRGSLDRLSPSEESAAKAICKELLERNFDDIDASIRNASSIYFYATVSSAGNGKYGRYKDPENIAKAIVYMAELLNLYWDDSIKTPYEIDAFKKTLLGEVVYKYGRYISAIKDKKSSASKASSGSTSAGANNGVKQPPKNNYKQSGPQSGNVRDLRDVDGISPGTPGNKVTADGAFIYRIIGDNPQSKNVPNVFINPLSKSGAAGSTNKVNFSSGNGYSDCTCFFDDPADAQNFLDAIIKANRIPVNVSNPRVVKLKADPNGYFIVGTEFGPCAISAKKLNEALTEAIDEEETTVVENVEEKSGWEKATENYSKEELEELHTWMRRG